VLAGAANPYLEKRSSMDWKNPISKVDPWLATILQREEQRQFSQICLAAASSLCSCAQREAQGSVFSNIDAEGYPLKKMQQQSLEELYDFEEQIAFY
jgi:glycine/serine hydroxymethyltransferase